MDQWDQLLELAALEAGLGGVEGTWVPLAEAESRTGVSRSALRAWYRSGVIESRVVEGLHGPQRLVPLEEVQARASQSPRIQKKAARAGGLEAEVAALRARVEDLERRLAAVETR